VVLLVVGCGGKSAVGPGDSGTPDGAAAPDASADASVDVVPRAFPPDQLSGTRIRARYWQVDDGKRIPQVSGIDLPVWFDNTLGTPCTWQPSAASPTDLTYVCTPSAAYRVDQNLFTDASCQTPARVARSYFYEWAANETGPSSSPMTNTAPFSQPWGSSELDRQTSCVAEAYGWDGEELFQLGAVASATLYRMRAGCTAVTPAPGEVVRSLGRKVAVSELATARVVRDDTGHRLSTSQLVSDDGARQRIGWYDNVLGVACTVGVAVDGKRRCLPVSVDAEQPLIIFTDAAGGQLGMVTAVPNPFKPGSHFRVSGESLPCGQARNKVYRVGAAYDGDLYTPGDPTPIPPAARPAGTFVHLTEVAAESMDLFEPQTLGGRLQVTAFVDAEGALDVFPFGATAFGGTIARFNENLVDSTLQQPCRFQRLADGSTRCLPAWSEQEPGLNCTRNVVVNVQPFTTCIGDPVPTFTAAWEGGACAGGYALSGLGALIMPNGGAVGQCFVGDPGGTKYYEIGAATPPATFAAATLMTD
jgi:hypothetical protein